MKKMSGINSRSVRPSAAVLYIFFVAALPTAIFSDSESAFLKQLPVLFFPAVVLSGLSGMLRTRTSLLIFGLAVVSSGFLIGGNLTGWFGHFAGEPKMWHVTHQVKLAGEDAFIVHLHIQNEGKGSLRLRLDPLMSPEQPSAVLSAKQYDSSQKAWTEYPAEKLLSMRSQTLFPAEIRPGGTMLVEMIFFLADRQEMGDPTQQRNLPGQYSISISDPARLRLYHHEIDIPESEVGAA